MHTSLTPLVLALALSPTLCAQSAPPPSRLALEHAAQVRELYGFDRWQRSPLRAGLPLDALAGAWVPGPLDAHDGRVARHWTRAGRPDARPSFVVESLVADTVDGAQALLLEWLAGLQSTARVPSTADLGLAIGDVGFVGRSGAGRESLAWVAFVRGNVAVRVSAWDARLEPDLDLAGVAAQLDLTVQATPALAQGAAVPHPTVTALAPAVTQLTAGERTSLDVRVVDPAGGEPFLRWFLAGEGQGYVERDAEGVFWLTTTGPGSLEVTLEVTGSLGATARATTHLDVAED